MTENEVRLLGLTKVPLQNDHDGIYHYYTTQHRDKINFFSCNSLQADEDDGEWYVCFEQTRMYRYYDFAEAQALMNNFDKHKYD